LIIADRSIIPLRSSYGRTGVMSRGDRRENIYHEPNQGLAPVPESDAHKAAEYRFPGKLSLEHGFFSVMLDRKMLGLAHDCG